MNSENISYIFGVPQPETELSEICDEVRYIVEENPIILKLIAQDQELQAKERKKLRLQDKQWRQKQMTPLPGLETSSDEEIVAHDLILEEGKKKMKPIIVLFFLILRGYIGGFKARTTQMLIRESLTIHNFLNCNGAKMPGWSTLIDNVNQIGNKTRFRILNFQLAIVLKEKLDNLEELTIDSTAVGANVSWPTDSGILLQLVNRIWRLGRKLDQFGINNMAPKRFEFIIKELKRYHKTIRVLAGKKNSDKKIKKLYKKVLKEARSALQAFEKEMIFINQRVAAANIIPTKYLRLIRVIEIMSSDIENLLTVISYRGDRIEQEKVLKAKDKIMSNSDKNAAFIKKGQREAVIGYKPQLGGSRNGFVTSIDVPEGNAADSGKLESMVDQHIERTRIIPTIVSVDDGYASAKGKSKVESRGHLCERQWSQRQENYFR